MYLKSIEMKGFKSFAGKMTLEFHDGVTAIVGPNGSGKSNISDAVRWVLGEQSSKQLRGGNMQDVIFAGTQSRKPLGFASVAITLDNSDHKLNIDYPEVTVVRRLFRSGESEYIINGSACRLKDIQELFYDTGIGKEGYSLIGQGQIDKILSGKPEERRELFYEAAGIVKFKRRKTAALKKLEKEESNLLRVADILFELKKQVGPLEKQAEKAKIYLQKRDELKDCELAVFLINEERTDGILKELYEKHGTASNELDETRRNYDAAKEKCALVENEITKAETLISELRDKIALANEEKAQALSREGILKEQIRSAHSNKKLLEAQLKNNQDEIQRRQASLKEYNEQLKKAEADLIECKKREELCEGSLEKIKEALGKKNSHVEELKAQLIEILSLRSEIKERSQKYTTLSEQIEVRASSLAARILKNTDEINRIRENEGKTKAAFESICKKIAKTEASFKEGEKRLLEIKRQLTQTDAELEKNLTEYHKRQSLLESLINLAERYEGYGGSVKRVMEQRTSNPGIFGVVAELLSTDKKYETAIETALGASLQNIVTDNEATAKYLIEYLKRGRYGRATFLPLTAVRSGDRKISLKDKGVIGNAGELIICEERFKPLFTSLLGRTIVVDTIDNAIAIGRRYRHQHRMVTLDGELISPGGAMTGGSYKNNANLLGRSRQIEELTTEVKSLRRAVDAKEALIIELKQERNVIRSSQSELNDRLQRLYLDKNTAEVNLSAALEQSALILSDSSALNEERHSLEERRRETEAFMKDVGSQMKESEEEEREVNERIALETKELEKLIQEETEALSLLESSKIALAGAVRQKEFTRQNIALQREEADRLRLEAEKIGKGMNSEEDETSLKEAAAEGLRKQALELAEQSDKYSAQLLEKTTKRDGCKKEYKALFESREELSEAIGLLDKECFRLKSAIEKNEAERDKNIAYIWDEYELTPAQLKKDSRDERSRAELLKAIAAVKSEIKGLGHVNVNAIEEYKDVKERHDFLSSQYEDLTEAAENLKGIISGLDKGMRKQFAHEFARIKDEFNIVFKRLFGGGTGTLELVEGEDILEAGIRIIAQPPGKKLQNMMQLSGGEKTLTAIALLFSIQNLKPSPFCILDEIEAALDDANVDRFSKYLHKLSKSTQFILITHRRGTMTAADRLYGITMQEKGISTMVSVDLIEHQLN